MEYISPIILIINILAYQETFTHVLQKTPSHVNHNAEATLVKSEDHLTDTCQDSLCVPHVQCPAHVRYTTKINCKTIIGRQGICCSTGQNHSETRNLRDHDVTMDLLTLGVVARDSRAELAEIKAREARLLSMSRPHILRPGSASYGHFRNSRWFNMADFSEMMDVASRALEMAIATRTYKDRQGLTNQQVELGVGMKQDLRPTPLGTVCSLRPICPLIPERFRRIDGTCNNLKYPTWGRPKTPYSRLLPPSYTDGIWAMRLSSVHGQPLPSARLISTTIIQDLDVPEPDYTLMVMQFGQFMSHDLTFSIDTSYANGSAISCCTDDGHNELHPQYRHYACAPIQIPKEDKFYGFFKQGCMNFVRSVLAPNHDCTLGYAQQMNKISHFIDGSSIYGSSLEQLRELRSYMGGRLKVFHDFGRDLLPLSKDPDNCITMEQGSACFSSGDTRTNQMVSLVVLHTIFLREHNRIAHELSILHPYWDDERLFLEARQIVIAEMQVIIYKEYLPAVIGDIAMEEFGLYLEKDGDYSYDYDEKVDPSVTNEFAAAVLRFGHSTVDGLLKVYGVNHMEEMISIPEVMFQPSRMRKVHFMDELLSTLVTEPMQRVDNNLPEALTRYMFRAGEPFGIDLAALNIQRARDHGLRPYNDYRVLTGLPKIQTFEEFGPELGPKLKSVYASVDDIDLWVGGLLEEKAPGSIVGYTFRDIIADQFYRLKKGDRYFFENDPRVNPGHFSPDQLVELRKVTLARVICDNADKILLARMPMNVFRKPGPGNELVDCTSDELPKLNLNYWRQ